MDSNWIMIADDDSEDQEMLVDAIAALDKSIPVRTVADGREALLKITGLPDEKLPCLLVLDYKMPYMNAAEVLEALSKDERYSRLRKVVWSSAHRLEDVNRCMKAGASDYFVKPARAAELKVIAKQMLESCKTGD